MSFDYLAGVTDPLAADSVIDWFGTFETWITAIGWTVESGSGTTDMILRSSGEAGGLTKLYMHIWKDPGNPTRLRMELQDDLAGTHATTRDYYLDSGGVQFAYFMGGDKDAVIISWKIALNYRSMYAGLLIPFALTITDETYQMIVAGGIMYAANGATILRNHDGSWDQNITLYYDAILATMNPHPLDDTFLVAGAFANLGTGIAGQLNHVGGNIAVGSINLEDRLVSGYPGATTTWIILSDQSSKFALRTGGVLPSGIQEGAHFASTSGVTTSPSHFLDTVMVEFLTGIGWTDLGDPGSPDDDNRLFYSTGESGTDDIYILVSWDAAVGGMWHFYVQDDAAGTHRSQDAWSNMYPAWFPVNYIISGDLDCVVWATQIPTGEYPPTWQGKLTPFHPSVAETAYHMAVYGSYFDKCFILRANDGTWTQGGHDRWDAARGNNSNPNAFDGTTYMVWPRFITEAAANQAKGVMRYAHFTHGGGVAQMDTITIAEKVYTVLFELSARPNNIWAIRTT